MCSVLLSRGRAAPSNMDNYRRAVVKSALLSAPLAGGHCVLGAEGFTLFRAVEKELKV